MSDPQLALQTALYRALTETPILYNGTTVPVYQFTPAAPQLPAILLSQATAVPATFLAACTSWDCSLLLTVMTRFAAQHEVSSLPAYAIQGDILARLLGKRLELGDGFSCSPIRVAQLAEGVDFHVHSDYLKYIRLKVKVQK